MPYDPDSVWDGTNFFGAGLKTMERVGRLKGLNLVGCDLTGLNAFFVDAAVCGDRFREPYTAESHYELPKYRSYWESVIGPHLGRAAGPGNLYFRLRLRRPWEGRGSRSLQRLRSLDSGIS